MIEFMAISVGIFICFAIGYFLGTRSERKGWIIRAMTKNGSGTPHHVDGVFYYIIPEDTFISIFTRRTP